MAGQEGARCGVEHMEEMDNAWKDVEWSDDEEANAADEEDAYHGALLPPTTTEHLLQDAMGTELSVGFGGERASGDGMNGASKDLRRRNRRPRSPSSRSLRRRHRPATSKLPFRNFQLTRARLPMLKAN